MRTILMKKTTFGGLLFALLLLAGARTALRADTLTPLDLSVLVQSTASDTDAELLYLLGGFPTPVGPPAIAISFNSTFTDTNWSGTLSGLYLGETLDLTYVNGTNSGSTINWDTTGSLGGGSLAGGGTATISYPTSSTFVLSGSDTLGYDGSTYEVNYSIPGSILGEDDYMFGTSGDEEVGIGTSDLNGSPILLSWLYSHETYSPSVTLTDIRLEPGFGWFYDHGTWYLSTTPGEYEYNEEITAPEPNSDFLLVTGLLAMALVMRKRIVGGIRRAT